MLGKGAKRKLDEDEEGLEGEALASPVASPAGEPVRGPEGLSVPEGLSKVSYTLQRQTIFNISLMKLYSQRPLTEPSLERRVLINNMLRRIQNELKQEGSLRPLLLPPSPPPDDPMDEGFREAPPSSFGALSSVAAAGGVAVQPSNQPQSGLLMPVLAPPSPHPLAPPATCLSSQPSAAPLLETCLTPASLLEEDGDSAFCASSSLPPTPPLSPPPPPPALPPSALTPLPPAPLSSLLLGQGSPREPTPASSNDGFPSTPTDMELDPPTAILSRTVSAAALTSATSTTTTSPGPSPLAQTPPLVPLPPSLTTAAGHPRDSSARTIGTPRPEIHGVVSTLEVRPMDVLPAHVPVHAPVPTSGLADITSPSLPSSPPSSSSPSAGFLSDLALDDILFADIDTSMYDFDPCTTSGATGAATTAAAAGGTLGVVTAAAAGVAVGAGPGSGLSKLSPVVTADDLLKSLACPYGGPAQQVSANQPFKIDLTELDHIMEVLVGS